MRDATNLFDPESSQGGFSATTLYFSAPGVGGIVVPPRPKSDWNDGSISRDASLSSVHPFLKGYFVTHVDENHMICSLKKPGVEQMPDTQKTSLFHMNTSCRPQITKLHVLPTPNSQPESRKHLAHKPLNTITTPQTFFSQPNSRD